MAEILDDRKEKLDEEEETECNEETEAPVFAKPKPKPKPDLSKAVEVEKPVSKPIDINVATPPHITSTQKVRAVREQEEELNSMLDDWESENQYVSYEALADEVVHPFLSKPKRTTITNQQRTIDLTAPQQTSPAHGVDDTTTIVSLSQFMECPPSRADPPAVMSKAANHATTPKALPRIDQSSPSEEDRVVADKVTEIVLEYQRLIQTKKRELAIKMKILKDEYYKEVLQYVTTIANKHLHINRLGA